MHANRSAIVPLLLIGILTIQGCEIGMAKPEGGESTDHPFARFAEEARCAVFGLVTGTTTVTPRFSRDPGSALIEEGDDYAADVHLLPSRFYGESCSNIDFGELRILLRLSAVSNRPTLGERAIVLIFATDTGEVVDGLPGNSYWPVDKRADTWILRPSGELRERSLAVDEALEGLLRRDIPIPEPEPPCGLNTLIVKRRLQIIESGEPWPLSANLENDGDENVPTEVGQQAPD